MRFLDFIREGYSNRGMGRNAAGTGAASDFTSRHFNWIGYNLQFEGSDPILREHFAAWITETFKHPDPTKFINMIRTRKFEKNAKPKFQQRHYWFMAESLKSIQNQWMWKYGYNFFSKNCKSEGFKEDFFRREATPKVFPDSDR